MSDKPERAPARKVDVNSTPRRRSALDAGFDRWLNKQLHNLYDPVLNELVPTDIADLLEAFDVAPDEPGEVEKD